MKIKTQLKFKVKPTNFIAKYFTLKKVFTNHTQSQLKRKNGKAFKLAIL